MQAARMVFSPRRCPNPPQGEGRGEGNQPRERESRWLPRRHVERCLAQHDRDIGTVARLLGSPDWRKPAPSPL
jgi:hypothetical protein